MEDPDRRGSSSQYLTSNFQRHFVTGLVTIIPLVVTLWVLFFIVGKIGGGLGRILGVLPILKYLPYWVLTGLAVVILIIATYFIGLTTERTIMTKLISWGERTINKLPLIRSIYTSSKQLTETLFSNKLAFKQVVLVRFPYKDTFAIGFVTSERSIMPEGNEKYLNVFVPTTPNPTSGWYLIVPKSEAIELDISTEQALKLVVSAGLVTPEKLKQKNKEDELFKKG